MGVMAANKAFGLVKALFAGMARSYRALALFPGNGEFTGGVSFIRGHGLAANKAFGLVKALFAGMARSYSGFSFIRGQ